MNPRLIRKYSEPVPRYTSYPTAPHFSPRVSELHAAAWLPALKHGAKLSLYVHIPFCHHLCWYCGCNTKATARYAPVAHYLDFVGTEITHVATLVPVGLEVVHMHWGGGSPNILAPADIRRLASEIATRFRIAKTAEFAVEVDPRHLDVVRVDALVEAGVGRVSIGVQDFNADVQAAIGRKQTFETTKAAVDAFRANGIRSINIDLMYGLPHQTRERVARTIEQVLELEPERIATFGYAHLPERMTHQRLIPEAALPDALERYAQSSEIAQRIEAAGYVRVGFDHFARPGDALAQGRVARNFQGYTTDAADALIGLGASAISRLPQGYLQNATAMGDYMRRIHEYGLATSRGIDLTPDDCVRAHVIERLMCDLAFSAADIRWRFGAEADPVLKEGRALIANDADGLLEPTPDGFFVTERGRPFIRSICARFDAYLGKAKARHSTGV